MTDWSDDEIMEGSAVERMQRFGSAGRQNVALPTHDPTEDWDSFADSDPEYTYLSDDALDDLFAEVNKTKD